MCRVWQPNSNIMPSLVHFLVSFFLRLIITNTFTVCAESSDQPTCPIWTYPSPSGNECICGNDLDHVVLCDPETLTVRLTVKFFCFMLFNSNGVNMTLLGTCPYGGREKLHKNFSVLHEDSSLCSLYNRKGQLCGECADNYTLPANSYYLGCVKCKDYNNGWIKFIVASFLPLTIFYIVVIICRISATSSTLNAFVMVNQIIASPPVIRTVYSSNLVRDPYYVSYLTQFSVQLIIAVVAIWNLEFFRSFYGYICIHPDLNYQQVLLLEYAIGIYPLFLILLTFILVKLHDNFTFVVWLWKPFHRCLAVFRRQWNIRSYLVHAFATFIVLSYVKILNTSFELLIPSQLYDMHRNRILKAYWYYDGRVDMTSKGYIPTLVLALLMLLFFNVLPLALLALYPFKCFQRLLNFFLSPNCRLVLQIYMDSFHGCYKDTSHDYRHFAALYLAVRFLNLLMAPVFNHTLYLPAAVLVFVFALALIAKFQPYKNKRNNVVDIILLFTMINGFISSIMFNVRLFMYPKLFFGIIAFVSVLIVLSYLLFLILACVLPKAIQCCKKCKTRLISKIRMSGVNEGYRALESIDYNSC